MSFWDFLKCKKSHTLNVDQPSKKSDTTIDDSSSEEKVQISITAKFSECSESDDSNSKPNIEPDDPDFPCIRLLMRLRNTWVKDAVKEFDPSLIQKHVDTDLLALSSLEMDLNAYTIPDLKEFLSQNNLKVSGKKSDLVHRLMENLSEDQIRTFAPDSYYYLTPHGEMVLNDLIEQQEQLRFQQKVSDIEKIAANPPEIISLYLKERKITDRKFLLVLIDISVLATTYENAAKDMEQMGYVISDDEIVSLSTGFCAFKRLLSLRNCGSSVRYKILTCKDGAVCPRCKEMNGKSFNVSEAEFGVTLPPFCDHCRCQIVMDI